MSESDETDMTTEEFLMSFNSGDPVHVLNLTSASTPNHVAADCPRCGARVEGQGQTRVACQCGHVSIWGQTITVGPLTTTIGGPGWRHA